MIQRPSIRETLAVLIVLFGFGILFYTLVKYGGDKGTLNLIIGSAITSLGLIGGYYFQSSHRPGVTGPTEITDTHKETNLEPLNPDPNVQPTTREAS
jgi:hypothetical protein